MGGGSKVRTRTLHSTRACGVARTARTLEPAWSRAAHEGNLRGPASARCSQPFPDAMC